MGVLYSGNKAMLLTEFFYTITFWKKRSIFIELMSIMIMEVIIINS